MSTQATPDAETTINTPAGWSIDRREDDGSVYFVNENDGAMVLIEPFSAYDSMANYVVRSQYVGYVDVMGRVRATVDYDDAVDAATEHMSKRA